MKFGEWQPVEIAPPIRRFVSGQGWTPEALPYVLAVDAKGRMSVGYAMEHSGGKFGYRWTFAKPIGTPTHWTPLPDPPLCPCHAGSVCTSAREQGKHHEGCVKER